MPETETQTLRVVPWTWRNGSVHLEMFITAFVGEDDEIEVHLDGQGGRFKTACGKEWFGVASSSGLGHTERITCETCRRLLANAIINIEVGS